MGKILDTTIDWKKENGALVSVLLYVRCHICLTTTWPQAEYLTFELLVNSSKGGFWFDTLYASIKYSINTAYL